MASISRRATCRAAAERLHVIEIDSDHWKTWVHQRLSTPLNTPDAMTRFHAQPQEDL